MKETNKTVLLIKSIRNRKNKLRNPETIKIYQMAENHLNQYLIENYGLYFNSQNEIQNVSKMHVLHLTNVLKKLKGDFK